MHGWVRVGCFLGMLLRFFSFLTVRNASCVLVIGLLEEAEFYNVKELIYLVKERIMERDSERDKVSLLLTRNPLLEGARVLAGICSI